MLLHITNLKALSQRFQVSDPRWRPQRRASMMGNAIIPDEKCRRKSFSDQRKRIYLVKQLYLKHGKIQRSRPNKNVVVTVISPRFVVSKYRGR